MQKQRKMLLKERKAGVKLTTEERLKKIEEILDEHDEKIIKLEKQQLTDRFELSKLITEAVDNAINKAIEPLVSKLEKQNERITKLEQAEAQKALKKSQEIWKTITTVIVTAVVSFCMTILINNFIAIASNNVSNEPRTEEVSK